MIINKWIRKVSHVAISFALSLSIFAGHAEEKAMIANADGTVLQFWQKDINDALKYREEALALFMEANEAFVAKKPLTGLQMVDLYKMNIKRHEIFRRLKKQGDLDFKTFKALKKIKGQNEAAHKVGMRSFLYYLLIDDNFVLADILFQGQKHLRRIMNEDNSAYKIDANGLHGEAENFYSFKMMSRKAKLNNYLNDMLKKDAVAAKITNLIKQQRDVTIASFMYQYKYKQPYAKRFALNMKHISAKLFTGQKGARDFFRQVADKFIFGISFAFGQTIGQYQWVPGKMKGNKVAEKKLLSILKPMDVIWDKSRNKVTGRIIPGFWNHNAIWLGTEEELKTLGIWDHALVVPHQAKIRAGKMVAEALRMGVVMNTLEHFLDVDDFAMARRENMTDSDIKEKLLVVFSNMGKSYDYNFNTNSEKDIICSELVLVAFPEINFLQTKLLDKWSTTPSDVAKETLPGKSLRLMSIYYNGSEINSHLEWHMESLITSKKTDIKFETASEKKEIIKELTVTNEALLAPAI